MNECCDQSLEFIIENWNAIASVISFFVGGVGGFMLKVVINRNKTSIKNKNISVSGDFAGRDMHK